MSILIHNTPQGTEKWHTDREGMYTGSNAYKLLGIFGASEYAKAVQTGFTGNFYTKRGHRLEEQAVSLYERIYDTKVARPGYISNDKYPTSLYSPDGIDCVADNIDPTYLCDEDQTVSAVRLPSKHILVEIKSFVGESYMAVYNSGPDIKILAQIHYGMFVTGLRRARLMIFNPQFAKKFFEDENGVQTPNPDYDPAKATKFFDIKYKADINNNFKRILAPAQEVIRD